MIFLILWLIKVYKSRTVLPCFLQRKLINIPWKFFHKTFLQSFRNYVSKHATGETRKREFFEENVKRKIFVEEEEEESRERI